jgi:hypothetical protein
LQLQNLYFIVTSLSPYLLVSFKEFSSQSSSNYFYFFIFIIIAELGSFFLISCYYLYLFSFHRRIIVIIIHITMATNPGVSNGAKAHRSFNAGAPALIEHKNLKFLIINNPTPATLPKFINELEKSNVKVVVRCCEPSYSSEPLEEKGIKVVDLQFDDGGAPSEDITKEWLKLVKETFDSDPSCFIAVHCVAGLGRYL